MIYGNEVGDAIAKEEPIIGAIFKALAADAQWTQNTLDAINEANLREAQQDFIDFYTVIEEIAKRSDSARLFQALAQFSYKADFAEHALKKAGSVHPS